MSIALTRDAADLASQAAGLFTVALAGGSTPEKTYTLLAAPDRREQVDWSPVYVFFSDERAVPADDPRSNFGMAQRTLLAGGEMSADHIFPVPTEGRTAAEAATEYADILSRFYVQPSGGPP